MGGAIAVTKVESEGDVVGVGGGRVGSVWMAAEAVRRVARGFVSVMYMMIDVNGVVIHLWEGVIYTCILMVEKQCRERCGM